MFQGICTQEVYDAIMNINLKKSTIGIPQLCTRLACNHISEALTLIFNESLSLFNRQQYVTVGHIDSPRQAEFHKVVHWDPYFSYFILMIYQIAQRI